MVVVVATNRAPRLPGDAHDDAGDREADQRVGDRRAKRDGPGRRDDGEAHVCICPGVVAVGDECRAVQPRARAQSDTRGHVVAGVPDRSGKREHGEVGRRCRVHEAVYSLDRGDARAEKDDGHDGEARSPLGNVRVQREGDPERDGR